MTARKVRSPVNPHIQMWDPYVDPNFGGMSLLPLAERVSPSPPAGWPDSILDALHEIYHGSLVGQTVIRSVIKRTTVYHVDGDSNNTVPDWVGSA